MTTDRGQRDDAEGVDSAATLESLLLQVAQGDAQSFSELYDRVAARVLGLVRRVLIDHSQSEEVTQEVLLEVWRTASRFEQARGSAMAWILTMAHRRAVDRVRSSQSSHDRDEKIGLRDIEADYDSVSETVEIRIEHERVKRAMTQLTALQREAISLAYYGGYSHTEVAALLSVPVGTVKTRLRDGMIRLRDALGVTS
ncbi:ECF RNA polymerase sigma factor SigK [Herbiconiux sp. CPCC 205716]|uniref:ECF RNA polymerase sigma factor SigK n=1 Tax=Herbiconiux gentiana TaxID=2970912 RepID=A0ABT2GEZ6_9MICO|nr:ECF RNA polymerase sigma factor SigK [Herbiconiux gentiana]MCS5714747.1 ECF RNA polymerase sigma factor SigK [Herbiconiux gentiana]